eukprot:124114_1
MSQWTKYVFGVPKESSNTVPDGSSDNKCDDATNSDFEMMGDEQPKCTNNDEDHFVQEDTNQNIDIAHADVLFPCGVSPTKMCCQSPMHDLATHLSVEEPEEDELHVAEQDELYPDIDNKEDEDQGMNSDGMAGMDTNTLKRLLQWINRCTGAHLRCQTLSGLHMALKDGRLLCLLANKVTENNINMDILVEPKQRIMEFVRVMGLHAASIHPFEIDDLYKGNNVICVAWYLHGIAIAFDGIVPFVIDKERHWDYRHYTDESEIESDEIVETQSD